MLINEVKFSGRQNRKEIPTIIISVRTAQFTALNLDCVPASYGLQIGLLKFGIESPAQHTNNHFLNLIISIERASNNDQRK